MIMVMAMVMLVMLLMIGDDDDGDDGDGDDGDDDGPFDCVCRFIVIIISIFIIHYHYQHLNHCIYVFRSRLGSHSICLASICLAYCQGCPGKFVLIAKVALVGHSHHVPTGFCIEGHVPTGFCIGWCCSCDRRR